MSRIKGRLSRDIKSARRNSYRRGFKTLQKVWFAQPGRPNPHRPPACIVRDEVEYAQSRSSDGVRLETLYEGYTEPKTPSKVLGDDAKGLFLPGDLSYQAKWVMSLPHGRVYESSTVISADNCLIETACFEFDVVETKDRRIFHHLSLPSPASMDKPVVSVCTDYSDNYFHFMLETVPRIKLYQDSTLFDSKVLYRVHKPHTLFQLEAFKTLSIDPANVVDPTDTPYLTSANLFATAVDKDQDIHRQMSDSLRTLFLSDPNPKKSLRIYLERGNTAGRRLLNETDVIDFLNSRGFKTTRMDGLSVAEQASLFARAEAVIGLHGAAFTNLAFCQEGTSVVEMFPKNYISRYFWYLSTTRKLNYCAAIGTSEDSQTSKSRDNFANTTMPISMLKEALERVGID